MVIYVIPLRNTVYDDRYRLRKLGAEWDSNQKFWYVPDGKDPAVFDRYMDETTLSVYNAVVSHMQSVPKVDLSRGSQIDNSSGKKSSSFKLRSVYDRPSDFVRTPFVKLGLPDDFVVLDTETTGVFKDDEVIELSVLDSNANEIYHSFFKPGCPVRSEATSVSGIKTGDLKNEPVFKDEWPMVLKAIGNRRIAGHNIGFDSRLIRQTLEKQRCFHFANDIGNLFEDSIDSYRLSQKFDLGFSGRSLGSLCERLGVQAMPNHRTSYDCLGVLYVLQDLEQTDYPMKSGSSRRLPNVSVVNGDQMQMDL